MTRPRILYRETYAAHSSAGAETLKALQQCPSMLDVVRADIQAAGIALVEGSELNFIELRIYAKRHPDEPGPQPDTSEPKKKTKRRRR